MLPVLLDVRRARQRRFTLVGMALGALALPFVAWLVPTLGPALAPATVFPALLGVAAVVVVAAAAAVAGVLHL